MQQTFPAGSEPRVSIAQVRGDLNVSVWDQPTIAVESDGHVTQLYQEGDALMISECSGDLELQVPAGAEINATSVRGDVSINGVRRVELVDIGGDVELQDIGIGVDIEKIGEAIALRDLRADVSIANATSLRSRGVIGADASISHVALVEIETVGADLSLDDVETVVVGNVGGDLNVDEIADALSCGNIGGDCTVKTGAPCEIAIGNVDGSFDVDGAASLHIGSVGGDCDSGEVQGVVEVGNVGGDASFRGVGGSLQVGSIGGDGELTGLKAAIEVGSIGGDLELQATFPAGSHTRLNVGGDASVELPENANLSIRAAVGGEVTGQSVTFEGGNLVSLVYGDGAADLELSVGGDLELRGRGNPRSSSTSSSWGDFSKEMGELGREMGKLGQELGREIAAAFQEAGWSQGSEWSRELKRKMDEQARRAQRHAEESARKAQRQAEEAARRAGKHASRVRVRVNDREWRMDPERLERLKEQARKAATEGIVGALEAVEQAIGNLGFPKSPKPPVPPTPPSSPPPPTTGQTLRTDTEGVAQREPSTQQTAGSEDVSATSATEPDREQEREAILRMIAEGRISPEEGDMLLEGLGG
jgi:type II secretory pathway pseudopilin PulG